VYLLDTNICIFAINRKNPQVVNKIKEKINTNMHLSSLTIAELEFGVENSQYVEKNRIALLKFISLFFVLPFDDEDAVSYGKLMAKLKRKGEMIGPIDMLLAAQALSKELILITNNVGEFSRIDGLKIEDWSKETSDWYLQIEQ